MAFQRLLMALKIRTLKGQLRMISEQNKEKIKLNVIIFKITGAQLENVKDSLV